MNESELIAAVAAEVKLRVKAHLEGQPLAVQVSVDAAEALGRTVGRAVVEAVLEAWSSVVEQVALRVGRVCPRCQARRKCKRRRGQPMQVHVLGLTVEVAKLYLECDCGAPGASITRLLTGLSSGEASAELKLAAGYCAAEHSYGKASRDLEVHYGPSVERTKVRRLAVEVENDALEFAEAERVEQLRRIEQEQRVNSRGPERLMLQGDGGTVRTGTLMACQRGDPGYGKKTPKTGRARRKRDTQFREIITLDVREPGETTASALDVVVPVVAAPGERSRRMLALSARKGLGENTKVFGLGDMGSQLADSFDEAFVGYEAKYSADWKHTCDYVDKAAVVLDERAPPRFAQAMKKALWNRQRKRAEAWIARARPHRRTALPPPLEKCPVEALRTYVTNNWQRLRAKEFKEQGLDYVSARAEAQVRDRTKARFAVAGAWRQENLAGKATLRAIVADGRWLSFREHYLRTQRQRFHTELTERLGAAVAQDRLRPDALNKLDVNVAAPEAHAAAA
jgi:hypothetical protein